MKAHNPIILICSIALLLHGCQKEIEVDLPPIASRTVVEGTIENDRAPIVFITSSQGFFDPVDASTLVDLYQSGADVKVINQGVEHTLSEICTDELPIELLEIIAEQLGFSVQQLQAIPVCGYTSFTLLGEFGQTYELQIKTVEGEEMSAVTKINELVDLNNVRFELSGNSDSLGFIYGDLADPDTLGNAYRWFAKRINQYPNWSEHAGEQKDSRFIAPLGSAFEDSFFNGLSFEFAYFRGNEWQSAKEDDRNSELGFFKTGDSVVVKGCVIDYGVYEFVNSFEANFSSGGNPFTFPANVKSNIDGGLGVWAGYGFRLDTLVCGQ